MRNSIVSIAVACSMGAFLAGCNNVPMNITNGNSDQSATIAWDPTVPTPGLHAKILSVDGRERGMMNFSARVNPGKHVVAWQCWPTPRPGSNYVMNSGTLTIDAKHGWTYFIQPKRLTKTVSGVRDEFYQMQTTVTRHADGKLRATFEPIYYTVPYSNTHMTGCEAEVVQCKGFLYGARKAGRFLCTDHRFSVMSQIGQILFKGPDWVDLND